MIRLRRSIAILLVAIMILPFAVFAEGEKSDIDGHWAEEALKYLIDEGVLNGYEDGSFRPQNPISRAEAATIIVRILEDNEAEEDTTAPVFDYEGAREIIVTVGSEFTIPQTSATDNVDEEVEVSYVIKDSGGNEVEAIDTTEEGKYTITYSAFDAAGNKAEDLVISVEVVKSKDMLLKEAEAAVKALFADYNNQDKLADGVNQEAIDSARARVEALEDTGTAADPKVVLLTLVEKAQGLLDEIKGQLSNRIIEIIKELYGREADYTEESWSAYAEAMFAAVAVKEDEEARQTDVNKALEELEEKYAALEIALEESVINKSQIKGYETIEEAIADAKDKDVILVREDTYELSKQLLITKAITIVGEGEVIIKAAEDFDEGTYNADKHLIAIVNVKGSVKLENLTVTGSRRSGINAFESADVQLKDIVSKDNLAAGLNVNNSKVTAENLKTRGNAWYGVNVDNGSSPSPDAPESEFILISGEIAELVQIVSDKGGVKVTLPEDYVEVKDDTGKIFWTNRVSEN